MENKMIDTHAHLLKETYGEDLETIIIKNLKKIDFIFNISWNLKTAYEVVSLSKKYPKLLPIIGIHPNHIKDDSQTKIISELREIIKNNKIYAIGEIGIDLYRSPESLDDQIEYFRTQLDLANELSLPVVLHVRDAYQVVISILKKYNKPLKILIHSWNSNEDDLIDFLNLNHDIYFGINGIITFPSAIESNKSIFKIPLNKLLVETDSPWLSPVPFRSKKNNPENIFYILKYLSTKLDMNFEALQNQIFNNTKDFFNF